MRSHLPIHTAAILLALIICLPASAELIYTPGTAGGSVDVVQNDLGNGLMQTTIRLRTSIAFDTISGGFATLKDATLHQNPANSPLALGGEDDTGFITLSATGQPIPFGNNDSIHDSTTELSVPAAAVLGGVWGPTDTYFEIAQLTAPHGSEISTITSQGEVLDLVYAGDSIGTLSGSFTVVPEPGSLTIAIVGVASLLAFRVSRRRKNQG